MALPDLLWACPECGEDRGLTDDRPGYRCRACGTRYRRDRGASIRAERPDGTETVRPPAEWVDMLPTPETIVNEQVGDGYLIRSAKVEVTRVTGFDTVHDADGFLNRIELWGDPSRGRLELRKDRVVLTEEGEEPEEWPLETLTAVQASSSTLQLNRRGEELVSFRFLDDSIHLWEELVHAVLRAFYRRTGRGTIVEFQPRIATS